MRKKRSYPNSRKLSESVEVRTAAPEAACALHSQRRVRFCGTAQPETCQKVGDLTVALPKFYVITIDELPGVFFRALIVGAYKLDCAADMAILVEDIRSILGHLWPPHPG